MIPDLEFATTQKLKSGCCSAFVKLKNGYIEEYIAQTKINVNYGFACMFFDTVTAIAEISLLAGCGVGFFLARTKTAQPWVATESSKKRVG
jgi:hypothetical protein